MSHKEAKEMQTTEKYLSQKRKNAKEVITAKSAKYAKEMNSGHTPA